MFKGSIFRVSSPGIISEVIGDEAVIVNLDSGAYYSVSGAGTEIWTVAQHGCTVAEAIQYVAGCYSGSHDDIVTAVTSFVQELHAEGLIGLEEPPDANRMTAFYAQPTAAGIRPFVVPVLEKYTDMAELLLLDPVHEVNGAGWPKPLSR